MNIEKMAEKLATREGYTVAEGKKRLKEVESLFIDLLTSGDEVKVGAIGTIKIANRNARAERQGRNPATKEIITIPAMPAYKTVVLKPSKYMKDKLNEAKA